MAGIFVDFLKRIGLPDPGKHTGKPARTSRLIWVLLVLGVVLLAVALLLLRGGRPAQQPVPPGDIARGQPLHAVQGAPGSDASAFPSAAQGDLRPAADLAERYFDFGSIGPSDVVERQFALSNQGSGDLIVQQAYTTCGCTTADLTSAVIPPGKTALITVRFDAGYHPAAGTTVRRGLILETNDPQTPTLEIWVQASVRK